MTKNTKKITKTRKKSKKTDEFNIISEPHLEIDNVKKCLHEIQEEFSLKIKLIDRAYVRIYEILRENGINPYILDKMTYKIINNSLIQYVISENKFVFAIEIHLKPADKNPFVAFIIKNLITSKTIENVFDIHKLETALTMPFTLVLNNNFKKYYTG